MTDGIDAVKATLDAAEPVVPGEGLTPPPSDGAPGQWDQDPGPDAPPPEEEGRQGHPLAPEGALLPLNDTGNGQRFALYCGDAAMYVPRVGWHVWDERRWHLDPDTIAVRRLAQSIQHRLIDEIPHLALEQWQLSAIAEEAPLRTRRKALAALEGEMTAEQEIEFEELTAKLAWIKKLKDRRSGMKAEHRSFSKTTGNSGRLENLLQEATTSLARDVEDLDADPLTVNTQSGILRFTVEGEGRERISSVALEPHARELTIPGRNRPQLITKMMPVDYVPGATAPRFEAFLARVQPDPAMRAFLQRWFGLSMTALPVQKFLYMYGMGANGKSLLANLMRRMMGDYATMVKIESLTGQNRKSGSDATPDMMKLIGARAAITNEPEEGQRLQEQKIKEMTGGDAMLVRALHSDFVEFTPYFKLTFTGNHKLEIRGTDDGIWRRPLLCPFDVQIPDRERDEKLGDKLFDLERPGILNWLVDGLVDFLDGGLQEPAQVLEATEEYRKDSDPIGDFLATCCVIEGGSDWTSARELIDACYLYQLENIGAAWQPGSISRKLKERSSKYVHPATGKSYQRHKRGDWGYSGIRLTSEFGARLAAAPRDGRSLPMHVSSPPPDEGGQ